MIKVEQLTKTYEGRKIKCEALKGVDFTLPESGLVFIIGKSGSGKSTLLNLLGGLDNATSGDIIVDGKRYSEFSVGDFDNFRNEKLGFVFQDFCLIEDLTVKENVKLVLDLQARDEEYAVIDEVFKAVGIDGLGDRRPKELSAGQKQRVAIARALVKNPKIILADEPTGNIDSVTATAVLEILKEMSANRLVVVISHNTDDAMKYGDRLIEIADGKIIRDITREKDYTEGLEIDLPEIVLPFNEKMNVEELKHLNEAVRRSRGEVYIDQRGSGFSDTEQPVDVGNFGEYENKSLKPKKVISYAAQFYKKRWFSTTLVVLIISFLMIVFGMAQLFTMFDGAKQIEENVKKYGDNGIIIKQGYYDEEDINGDLKTSDIVEITDDKIAAVQKAYDGKVYAMYQLGLDIKTSSDFLDSFKNLSGRVIRKFYANETNGTLVCDIDYLKRLYGDDNGNLNLLGGEIKEDGGGIIITDYIADSILYYNRENRFESYDEILDAGYIYQEINVDAIIDTDYEEKYGTLREYALSDDKWDYYDETTLNFIDEALNYLSVCYSINPNFKEDFLQEYFDYSASKKAICHLIYDYVKCGESAYEGEGKNCYFSPDLNENEMYLSYNVYNELFGTHYTTDDVHDKTEVPESEAEIVIKDNNGEEILHRTFTIKGLMRYGDMTLSNEHLKLVKGNGIRKFALYTENSVDIINVINEATELDMYQVGYRFGLIRKITNIVGIFDDIFFYIGIALCIIIVVMLIFNSLNSIRQNTYIIGIIRAMGGKTSQLTGIFTLQTAVTGLLICALTMAGSRLGVMLFNDILLESLMELLHAPGISDITILAFDPVVVGVDIGIILALTIITVIVPVISIRRIQPIKIIRARE